MGNVKGTVFTTWEGVGKVPSYVPGKKKHRNAFSTVVPSEMGNLRHDSDSAEQSVQEFHWVSSLLPFLLVFIIANVFTDELALICVGCLGLF